MTIDIAAAGPTTLQKLRGLRWNTLGDSANTVFVQFTYFGSVFVLFLSQLGLSKSQIGPMLSFFPFAGLVAPFIAPAVARFGCQFTFWSLRVAYAAALGQLEMRIPLLAGIWETALAGQLPPARVLILRECVARLPESGIICPEYILLALYVLTC